MDEEVQIFYNKVIKTAEARRKIVAKERKQNMVNEMLGRNVRKCRLELGWTQEKLAEVLCVSHQIISKWENGLAAPDIEVLCAMARIFEVSLDEK